MRVVTVAPLASGIPYEELSYFGRDDIHAGDLVEITIKRRISRALVLTSEKAEEERQSLRHASFGLKKVSKTITKEFLHQKLWNALSYTSSYLLRPIGTILYDLISERSFASITKIEPQINPRGFEILLLEQSYAHRITHYKTTVREAFSKKQSIVIFFPTITDLECAKNELSRGIDEYVIPLHSGLTDKQYTEAQNELFTNQHPLLILSTPSLLPWVRVDLGLVIIEREHSHYYYTHGDGGYDMRFVLMELCKGTSTTCLLGSHMLSLNAHLLHKTRDANEVMPMQYRNDAGITIVPMIDENKTSSPYLSKQSLSLLHMMQLNESGHYFFYSHRKGMYPTTVCSDCGLLFTCSTCNRPYVLHKIGGVRTYVCHGCENIIRLDDDSTLSCKHCGGWRMTTLGIATTGIEEELQRLGIPLFVIDGERTPTRAKIKKTYKEWTESKYGVLIGTEMAHNVVTHADGIVILSLDSLFALPEYRNDEKVLTLVTEMAEKVKQKSDGSRGGRMILQTRMKNLPVIKQLISPSFREVFDTLLSERERFLLPPYYTVIKASFDNLQDQMKHKIEEELGTYVIEWFEQGRGVTLLFIHIKESEWSHNQALRERIKRVVYDGKPIINPLHFFIG